MGSRLVRREKVVRDDWESHAKTVPQKTKMRRGGEQISKKEVLFSL